MFQIADHIDNDPPEIIFKYGLPENFHWHLMSLSLVKDSLIPFNNFVLVPLRCFNNEVDIICFSISLFVVVAR